MEDIKQKYFRDNIINFQEKELETNEDIFKTILKEREHGLDSKRFFLEFLPMEAYSLYDFDNPLSLQEFRKVRLTCDKPIMQMGGCNMHPDYLEKDRESGYLRYAGIKMSDPYGRIYGQFDIRDNILTYSPIFQPFYKERDLCKFANDTYFTTMTFEDIMLVQIDNASEYFVHIGNVYKIGTRCPYVLEKVTKEQMIKFIFEPTEGEAIYKKTLNISR